jgi:Fur family transcriptional regulator, stress-responsive regulator
MTVMYDDIDQLLRRNGVQVTAQRLAIMRSVSSHPHATADELTDDVRAVIGSISRQAVYDTLGVLVNKNLVRRIQSAGSAARYEDRVGDNHHHLICRGCGTTFDIDCAVGAAPCLTADGDHGFEIDEVEVIYWGHCPSCRKTAADAGKEEARSGSAGNSKRRRTAAPNQKECADRDPGDPARESHTLTQ